MDGRTNLIPPLLQMGAITNHLFIEYMPRTLLLNFHFAYETRKDVRYNKSCQKTTKFAERQPNLNNI